MLKVKWWQYLLLPLGLIYGLVAAIRNFFYDQNLFRSYKANCTIISIGNLEAGGSGKTPFTLFLVNKLKPRYHIVVLSRGYGRKTKGFYWVHSHSPANEVGDEPLLYKINHETLPVAVCESREYGIKQIMKYYPETEVILLDDAFQHRSVLSDYSILLTNWQLPYFNDLVIPAGRLREFANGYKRADAIIATKCPETISADQKIFFKEKSKVKPHQLAGFALYRQEKTVWVKGNASAHSYVLVTGIANASGIDDFYAQSFNLSRHLCFKDHHVYTKPDIAAINRMNSPGLLTTAKDWVKLREYAADLNAENIGIISQAIYLDIEDELLHQIINMITIKQHG